MDQDSILEGCSNQGRWGPDDELGTLNYITDGKRLAAARLVRHGHAMSVGKDLSKTLSQSNPNPVVHMMLYEKHAPEANFDYVGIAPHGFGITHIDAIGHVYWDGEVYNGRSPDRVCTADGLQFGSIHAQRDGIFTRGVLLDVAEARGVQWLSPDNAVTAADLDKAEGLAGTRIERGDAVLVRVGLGAREAVEGPEDTSERAGLDAGAVVWLHEREAAVFGGDCIEKVPGASERIAWPLHQIGLARMGLALLEALQMEALRDACHEYGSSIFLLVVAPLRLRGGTGSAVNPICVF